MSKLKRKLKLIPICGIYQITNKLNQKYYIGKSIDIEYRWTQHKHGNTKIPFSFAIKKYGIENFDFKILEEVEYETFNRESIENKLITLEQKWFDILKPFLKKNGYNISSKSIYNPTKKRSKEFGEKISKIRIKMNCSGKLVKQYNLNGEIIFIWKSAAEIEKITGIKASNISRVCLKKQKSAGGFIWRFDGNELSENDIINSNIHIRHCKQIQQLTKDDIPLKVFNSISDAAKSVNSKYSSSIIHICKGDGKTYKGFKWKYIDQN